MKHGICKNYNNCDSALADKIVEIHNTTQIKCKECGSTLEIIEEKAPINWRKVLMIGGSIGLLIVIFFLSKSIMNANRTNVDTNQTNVDTNPIVKAKKTLRICGSNTINHKIMPKMVKHYLKKEGYTNISDTKEDKTTHRRDFTAISPDGRVELTIDILADGTLHGYDDLKDGTCDIAASYGQMDSVMRKRNNFIEDSFAFDAIAMVVNKSNGLRAIKVHDIQKIYNGEFNSWSQVEGAKQKGKIVRYIISDTSGIYREFKKDVENETHPMNIQYDKQFKSHKELLDAVSNNKKAIGFVSYEQTQSNHHNTRVLDLKEGEHLIALESSKVISEEYELYDELYLYLRADSGDLAKDFRAYADSIPAQEWLDVNTSFIGADIITDDELAQEAEEKREILEENHHLSTFVRNILEPAIKTPIVFHFEPKGVSPDHETEIHLRQIKYLMKHHDEYQNSTLLLIGYSDVRGEANDNLILSQKRARSVARKIKKYLNEEGISHKIETTGFGENEHLILAPNPDNNRELRLDRRVEVWLK